MLYAPAVLAFLLILASCASPPNVIKQTDSNPELVRLGKSINSEYDEFAPQLDDDASELIFTSGRPLPGSEEQIHHLYRSRRTADGLSPAEYMAISNDREKKAGAVSYDYVHNQVYFVQCYMPDGFGDCDLYVADLDGHEWKNIRNLGPVVNGMEWDAHPSISRDGNTLYFSSEREGDSDIYMSERTSDGTWSEPENIGEPINTGGDEKTPFISNDGRYLYFCSDYHPGFGEFDLFRSEKKGNKWMPPLNLGMPYNSIENDVFLTTTTSGDTTYLSSNRIGGLGGYDVYEIRRVPIKTAPDPEPAPVVKPKPLIVRYTIKNAFTGDPIHAFVTYSAEGIKDIELQSLSDGIVQHEVLGGREYEVTATSPGFENGVSAFFYPSDESGIKDRVLMLTPIREEERKIYSFVVEFDFDLFNIRPEEAKKLDTAAALLTEFPNSTVVVSGHTDAKGTETYNIRLGYNRAHAVSKYVKSYLQQKGVKLENKMEIRTYGESKPIATNETDEGRQRNRRVEIAIVRNE